jgi:hypothetical protein
MDRAWTKVMPCFENYRSLLLFVTVATFNSLLQAMISEFNYLHFYIYIVLF